MTKKQPPQPLPEILAPAGNRSAFLAALAAGADAVYCGLKQYSARMAAKNFTIEELAGLTSLAHEQGARVYAAINTLIKPGETASVAETVERLVRQGSPDGMIVQDLAMVELARQAGFSGEIHLSTLANVSFPKGIAVAANLGAARAVLPRELSIDEIQAMAQACPPGFGLEVFVHGALCYGVSGRCYWSSYLGGKSGLRGRCVQPCRRRYVQNGEDRRLFSCLDLSLDVLVKVLKTVPQVRAWKIEGRKKGPHYVYYTARAYRTLRDEGTDPEAKKEALSLLSYALGRPGTHYRFLSQRPWNPIPKDGQTGSGLLIGRLKGGGKKADLVPKIDLLSGDVLRVGYEDEPWHGIHRLGRFVPKAGRYTIRSGGKTPAPKGTPVFLTDRTEEDLQQEIAALEKRLTVRQASESFSARVQPSSAPVQRSSAPSTEVTVFRSVQRSRGRGVAGCWLSVDSVDGASGKTAGKIWWMLPPVIWPDNEKDTADQVARILKKGARDFILNAPWQAAFFPRRGGLNLWAGPFCNLANTAALLSLTRLGFSGAVVSPELGKRDYTALARQSPLPLGAVIYGYWPLCISRTAAEDLAADRPLLSPRKEAFWVTRYGPDYWVFPNWPVDLRKERQQLQKAGYTLFLSLEEPVPPAVKIKQRPGLWNWATNLK
ncbi:MAG: U32 family peptidase [Desulfobacterales bacterium]|nr:U32 family peptidase [Desulfobacterales bacterium]